MQGESATDEHFVSFKSDTDSNLNIKWEKVKGAAGYEVSRRVFGRSYITIADVGNKTSYIDKAMLNDMPYQYRIIAYRFDENNNKQYSSWSNVLLWVPKLPGPDLNVSLSSGIPTLTWSNVEGVSGYTVFRSENNTDWYQIAEPLGYNVNSIKDMTACAGEHYFYKVVAYLANGRDTYEFASSPVDIETEGAALELQVPEIIFAEQVGSEIQILWEPVPEASAYRVYCKTDGSDTWEIVNKSITGNMYKVSPKADGKYIYAVQALYNSEGCTYYGIFDESFAEEVTYTK